MCQNQFHDFPYLLPTLNEKKSGENFVFFFWGKELRCDHYHQWVRAAQAPKQKSTVLAMVSPEFRRHPGLAAATHTEDQRWTETATGGTCTLSPLRSGTKVTQSGEPAVKFQWKGRSELILCRRLLLGDEVTPKGARESRPQWNQKPGHSWDRKPPEQGGYSWKAWLRRQCLAPLKAALKSATASRAW